MTCCICMENFGDDNPTDNELGNPYSNVEVAVLPCKSHYFHEECIGPWIMKQNTCPVCRVEITLEALKKQKKELATLMKTIEKDQTKQLKDTTLSGEDTSSLLISGSNINS